MSFQIPLQVNLSQSGLVGTLGWQALDANGTIVSAFTKANVRIAGAVVDYTAGVVTLPDTAALIQWGIGNGGNPETMATVLASEPVSKPLDALSVAAAVWNALTSTLTTAGSIGAYLLSRLGIVGSGAVTVVAPVAATGNVSLTRGDDYCASDGRALQWSATTWPNLTGATIAFVIEGDLLDVAGSVIAAGTGTQTVQVELSAADTAALVGESYSFSVVATLATSNHTVTLVEGLATVDG